MPDTSPAPAASRVRVTATAVTAVWLFVLSGFIGAEPGRPIASRIDAYFQNDAGGRIEDAVAGTNTRAVLVHPLFFFVFTLPIHKLVVLLAGVVPPELSAVYACRVYAASAAGVGIGRLTAALVRAEVPPLRLAACGPLLLLGTAQTLAALPDHFALSFGILSAAFGVFLDDRSGFGRNTGWKLIALTVLAGGITLTNAAFPAGLLAWRWLARRGSIPRWAWPATAVALAGGVAFGWWVSRIDPRDFSNPFGWRVRGYLSGRLLDDPGGAAARAFRGFVDVTVGPTPAVDTNNYHKNPMLTYEPAGRVYPAWPYDPVQGTAAGVWLGLFTLAVGLALRDPHTRWPAAVLLGWACGNVAFHVLWGDEFFLYTPHYSWAIAAAAMLGLRRVPYWLTMPAVLAVAVGQVHTLVRIRDVAATLGH